MTEKVLFHATVDAALTYLSLGMQIVADKGKIPFHKRWLELRYNPLRTIKTFGKEGVNVGILTGAVSGIVVIDIDVKHVTEEQSQQIIARTGCDMYSRTPTGGYHLYFRHNGSQVASSRILPGIEIKSDGHQVVEEPSIHPNGGVYRWVLFRDKPTVIFYIDLITNAILDIIQPKSTPVTGDKWIAEALSTGAIAGDRNNTAARLAGYFASHTVPQDIALSMLMLWNQHNKPPLSATEITRTCQSVFETVARRTGIPDIRILEDTKQSSARIERAASFVQIVQAEEDIKLNKATGYNMGHDKEVEWMVEGWLPSATMGLVVAPPGSYKTWMLLDLGLSIASGNPFLGQYPVQQTGGVIFLQQEDSPRDLARRLKVISLSKFLPNYKPSDKFLLDYVPNPVPDIPLWMLEEGRVHLEDNKSLTSLATLIQRLAAKLVIIDPMYTITGTDDFMASAAGKMTYFKQLRDALGVSIVIAHHTRKSINPLSVDRQDAWGSQFLNAWLETGWQIRQSSGHAHTVAVQRHFKSATMPDPLLLTFHIDQDVYPTQYEVVADNVQDGDGTTVHTILHLLKTKPTSAAELAEQLQVARSTITRALQKLIKLGAVQRDGNVYIPSDDYF